MPACRSNNPLDPPSRAIAEAPERRPSAALLSIDEVATRLNISTKSVRSRIKTGLIRPRRLGARRSGNGTATTTRLVSGSVVILTTETPAGPREMLTLPLPVLVAWQMTVDANKVARALRENVRTRR
jgi:hypothetical protein